LPPNHTANHVNYTKESIFTRHKPQHYTKGDSVTRLMNLFST